MILQLLSLKFPLAIWIYVFRATFGSASPQATLLGGSLQEYAFFLTCCLRQFEKVDSLSWASEHCSALFLLTSFFFCYPEHQIWKHLVSEETRIAIQSILPETNIAPENGPFQNEKIVLQPPFFRIYVSMSVSRMVTTQATRFTDSQHVPSPWKPPGRASLLPAWFRSAGARAAHAGDAGGGHSFRSHENHEIRIPMKNQLLYES